MSTYRKLVAVRHSMDFRAGTEIHEVPLRAPGAGEILLRTLYSGINAADRLMAAGKYLSPTPLPFDLGGEAVGEVLEVGEGVTTFQPGDFALTLGGGFSERIYIRAAHAVPVPQASAEVVSFGVGGLTASIALDVVGEMKRGETVLVTAAAGGTGSYAVQLAKLAGCTVIGTCSSEAKAEALRALGCDRPVNYRDEDLNEVIKAEFRKGLDVAFESVGGDLFDTCLKRLAVRGRLVVIGAIAEYERGFEQVTGPRVHSYLLSKSASVRGFWLMHFFREHGAAHLFRLVSLWQDGKLKAEVDPARFVGLESVADALDHLYAGSNTGKVVVAYA